jgi:hypothetical protein
VTDPTNIPERLVAVYPSRAAADAVVDRLVASGIDRSAVALADHADEVAALYGEMHEETGRSWSGAPSALVTKEQAKGLGTVSPVTAAIGAVLGIIIGLVGFGTLMPWWGRLLLGAAVGALFGAVVGAVIGAGLGARGPAAAPVAQGTTVSVHRADPDVRRILASHDVIRIDLVAPDGSPIGVVETEEDHDDDGEVDHLRERFNQPTGGDWSSAAPEEPRAED